MGDLSDVLCRSHALAEALHAVVLEARIALAQERDGMLTHAEFIAKLKAEALGVPLEAENRG